MEITTMEVSRFWLLLIGLVSYLFIRTIYRLYFHPLSGIPGPKLTAATHWYEFYYDMVQPGRFLFQIEKMHEKYGPIVRITPREVHINDATFYNEIYAAGSRKRDKDSYVAMFSCPDSMISTFSHAHHRSRRGILNGFFSKASVLQLSNLFEERVEKLVERLKEFRDNQSVVPIHNLFAAMTSDLICAYSCGRHWGFLDDPELRNDIREANESAIEAIHLNRFLPWMAHLPHLVSPQTLAMALPGKSTLFKFLDSFLSYSIEIACKDNSSSSLEVKSSVAGKGNMIKAMVDPSIPTEERSLNRVRDELSALLAAGTETTSSALTMAIYHLGSDKAVRDKLRAELKQIMVTSESKPTWPELEKLPYMSAFVNETLRLSYGTIGRLVRIAPAESLRYGDYVIPPGTPMSSSTYFIHRDASIFPNPEKFDPERWIKAAENGENLGRYLTSFSKGSRTCIAMNFAQMQMFLAIAHFARWFDVELCNTDAEDLRVTREMFVPRTRRGGFEVYAKISSGDN